jgi:hypothetical protein
MAAPATPPAAAPSAVLRCFGVMSAHPLTDANAAARIKDTKARITNSFCRLCISIEDEALRYVQGTLPERLVSRFPHFQRGF